MSHIGQFRYQVRYLPGSLIARKVLALREADLLDSSGEIIPSRTTAEFLILSRKTLALESNPFERALVVNPFEPQPLYVSRSSRATFFYLIILNNVWICGVIFDWDHAPISPDGGGNLAASSMSARAARVLKNLGGDDTQAELCDLARSAAAATSPRNTLPGGRILVARPGSAGSEVPLKIGFMTGSYLFRSGALAAEIGTALATCGFNAVAVTALEYGRADFLGGEIRETTGTAGATRLVCATLAAAIVDSFPAQTRAFASLPRQAERSAPPVWIKPVGITGCPGVCGGSGAPLSTPDIEIRAGISLTANKAGGDGDRSQFYFQMNDVTKVWPRPENGGTVMPRDDNSRAAGPHAGTTPRLGARVRQPITLPAGRGRYAAGLLPLAGVASYKPFGAAMHRRLPVTKAPLVWTFGAVVRPGMGAGSRHVSDCLSGLT
nr:hypothetical protein [uncultured Rhodopila sp.]